MIFDVQITLAEPNPRLDTQCIAYARVIIDGKILISDFRLIRSPEKTFVSEPSCPIRRPCPDCRVKIPIQSAYCSWCGRHLDSESWLRTDPNGRHMRSVVYPINHAARESLNRAILTAYDHAVQARNAQLQEQTHDCPHPA